MNGGKTMNMKKLATLLITSCFLLTVVSTMTVSAAAPDKPDRPSGPWEGITNEPIVFSTDTNDDDQDPIYYRWRIRHSTPDGTVTTETDYEGPYTYPDYSIEKTFILESGRYTLYAQAIDDPNGDGDYSDGTESPWSANKNFWISELPDPPTVEGPTLASPWEPLLFTITPNDDTWLQQLQIDWGVGQFDPDDWDTSEIYDNGPITKSYMYIDEGIYTIRVRTREAWDTGLGYYYYYESDWTEHTIEIRESPPEIPELTGPDFAFAGQSVMFSAVSQDEDDSYIQYFFDFGDGDDSYWIPEDGMAAGELVQASHTYTDAGTYNVRVKARDETGETDWSESIELTVHSLRLMGISGGLNPGFTIQNSGDVSKDVEWSVELIGGVPGFHLNREYSGSIESVKPDTTASVSIPMQFGLGNFEMSVTLDIAGEEPYTQTYDVFIFFIYMRI